MHGSYSGKQKNKVVIKGNERNKAVIGKRAVTNINAQQSEEQNTIRNIDSTALYAAYTVDTVYTVEMVYTVDMVYTVEMVYTIDMVFTVDRVYTVDIVYNFDMVCNVHIVYTVHIAYAVDNRHG